MKNQEDGKSHLSLVVDNGDAPLNYAQMIADITKALKDKMLTGEKPDIDGAMQHLDANEDNAALRDWLVANSLMTKAAFDKKLARITRNRAIQAELGFVPSDAMDFVRKYADRENIRIDARGTIKRQRAYAVGPVTVDASNCDTSEDTRLIYDVANSDGDNLDSYGRELRLLNDRLNLGYRDGVISDALSTWQEECTRQMKIDALLAVRFEKGKATGPVGDAMWEAMERACFDVSDTRPGFAIAVIKKFIWQVKRKARDMPVTNHLMPVITGAQGKGKTVFVQKMLMPMQDMSREVDFRAMTDGKTMDIWSFYCLFIDEMGFFSKADVDQVKNIITTDYLNIRAMRQNFSANIRNSATLIGCSNKSLAQLIRDETGVRRFAELSWKSSPDWEASNALDWTMLWQSVDERGPDPVIAAGMMDALRDQQESNRNQSPVEVWARDYGNTLKSWTRASDLHVTYREWEREAFPRADTNLTMFGKQMKSLCESMADFPMERKSTNKGIAFRFADKGV